MQVDLKEKIYKLNGNTENIVDAVLISAQKNYHTCSDIAKTLNRLNKYDTCKAIFDYVINNLKYKVDPTGKQWIKTPARLLYDGVGDCKSFSIFIVSCLECLGIKCAFRFVSYANGDFTHVYVIAFDENNNKILIDPVAYIQRGVQFNNEIKFVNKKDIDMRGTEIAFLSGINKIGESPLYYSEDNATNLKLNINELYSEINLLQSRINISKSQSDINKMLVRMDLLQVCINMIKEFGETSELETVGYVIGAFQHAGEFNKTFVSMDERLVYFTELENDIKNQINTLLGNSYWRASFILTNKELIADFLKWWEKTVIAQNYQQKSIAGIGATSINWTDDIKKAGPYFVYTVADSVTIEDKKAWLKKIQQNEYIGWLESCNLNLSRNAILNIIESGVIDFTDATPNDVVKALKSGKFKDTENEGLGEITLGVPITAKIPTTVTVPTPVKQSTSTSSDKLLNALNVINQSVKSVSSIAQNVYSIFQKPSSSTVAYPNYNAAYNYRPSVNDWVASTFSIQNLLLIGGAFLIGKKILDKKKAKKQAR